jgi:hypothetical protein
MIQCQNVYLNKYITSNHSGAMDISKAANIKKNAARYKGKLRFIPIE